MRRNTTEFECETTDGMLVKITFYKPTSRYRSAFDERVYAPAFASSFGGTLSNSAVPITPKRITSL